MAPRTAWVIGATAVLVAGGLLFAYEQAAPYCDDRETQDQLYQILARDFHRSGILVNNVTTQSGGWFSASQTCSAQIATIAGNVSASKLTWQAIRYRIARPAPAQPFTITVTLGKIVPLEPERSLWDIVASWL